MKKLLFLLAAMCFCGCNSVNPVGTAVVSPSTQDSIWSSISKYPSGSINKGWSYGRYDTNSGAVIYQSNKLFFDSIPSGSITGRVIKYMYAAYRQNETSPFITMYFLYDLDFSPDKWNADTVRFTRYDANSDLTIMTGQSPSTGNMIFHKINEDSLVLSDPSILNHNNLVFTDVVR